MRVLYIAEIRRHDLSKNNSFFEYLALKKIFKNVDLLSCTSFFIFPKISRMIFHRISPKIFEYFLNYFILSKIKRNYDLIYVNNTSAAYIGKKLIINLKKKTRKIVVFINDNPFTKRDNNRWKLYLDAANLYDLTATYHASRVRLGKKFGIKNIILVNPSYQKDVHIKKKITKNERKKLSSDIAVIATWFPERGIFFKKLIRRGLSIKIYGTRWDKDPNYSSIKSQIVLGHVDHPLYSKIIQSAKLSICLPSKGNLDGITRRSVEIPAIGTLLLAKRSREHKKIFKENIEALFFKNVSECYKKCIYILKNNKKRKKIAKNGNIKVTKILKCDYYNSVRKIRDELNIY